MFSYCSRRDPGGPLRQVNEAELVWNVKYALRRISRSQIKAMASPETSVHRMAVQIVAEDIVRQLCNYEVLSQAPEPERDPFIAAAYRDR